MISVETLDYSNWVPVELLYNSVRSLPLSSYTQQYTAGFSLHHNNALVNALDVNVQYDAFTALIPFVSLTGMFVEQSTSIQPNLIGNNVLLTYDGNYALVYNSTSARPTIASYTGDQQQYHRLIFTNDTVQIMYNDGELLTVNDDLTLSYKLPLYAFPEKQLFNYSLSGNKLALFTALPALTAQRVVRYDPVNSGVSLVSSAFVSGSAINNHDFWTLPNGDSSIQIGFDYQQYNHQYFNNFGANSTNTTTTINTALSQVISSNYLVTFPLRNVVENGGTAAIEIVPLKNNQNHNHRQIKTPSQFTGTDISRTRTYTGLSFPPNQSNVSHDPGLVYHSNLHEIELPADKETLIHYPYNGVPHALSASDLAAMGSTPAFSPAYSDRINKRLFGYNCSTYQGDPSPRQNGTLLCSWLSGDQANNAWMDRWYDANTVTQGNALFATVTSGTHSAVAVDYIWDIPSTVTFEPGVAYSYFRQGPTSQAAALAQETAADILVKIDKWYPPTDTSVYQHNVMSYNGDQVINDRPFQANGTNSFAIATIPELSIQNQMTMACWVYAQDWSTINANQLFGHYYESGAGLFFDTGTSSIQTITYGDENYGFLTTLNNQYEKRKQIKLQDGSAVPSITDIATTRNLTKWALDAANRMAHCFDYSNTIIASVFLPLSAQFQYLQVDSTDAVYTMDILSHTLIKMTQSGIVSSFSIDVSANNFVVNSQDEIVTSYTNPGTVLAIDSSNNLWRIVGNNVYKNDNIVFHSGINTCDVAVDASDNIWVARGSNNIYKLNNDGVLLSTTVLPRNVSSNTLRISFIREQLPNGVEDFALVTDPVSNKMIKISMVGNIVTCIDLRAAADTNAYMYPSSIRAATRGDITGFEVGRKFMRTPHITAKVRVESTCDVGIQTFSTSVPASALSPGWHHVAFVFDSGEGCLQLYVDGTVYSQFDFEPDSYLVNYKYHSPLVISNDSGKFGLLKDELGFTNTSNFVGQFDQFRYYRVALQKDQVRSAMAAKTPFNTLFWNVHTDTRYPQVEHVKSWFTHRLQTHKSNAFDVKIKQLGVTNEATKLLISEAVAEAIKRIKPGYTQLRQIKWV